MIFRTAEPSLKDILNDIGNGKMQLPDFQRSWLWDDENIKSLIASVSLAYPIGVMMFLEAGKTQFQYRSFFGVNSQNVCEPKRLVLDGQQRLTAMYLALRSGQSVRIKPEKGDNMFRIYFLDIKKCLEDNSDREAAVISISAHTKKLNYGRKTILDLSSRKKEYEHKLFPTALMFNEDGFTQWEDEYKEYYQQDSESRNIFNRFKNRVWSKFQEYKLAAIELTEETPIEAICQVFEKVNTAGVTLTVFELVTATFAKQGFNLRINWEERQQRFKQHKIFENLNSTHFLTAITLLANYEKFKTKDESRAIPCKRTDVLKLSLEDFKRLEQRVEIGFNKTAELLAEECIFDAENIPYIPQLIPLAVIYAYLNEKIDLHSVKQKILRWYWCGVFGELYSHSTESRFGEDVPDVINWIMEERNKPRTISDASFVPTRLLSLQTRTSAAYKGLIALLMKYGCKDFISGTPIDSTIYLNIEIHHIFPQQWFKSNEVNKEKWNSIINKTMLATSTNKFISNDSPSKYLAKIRKDKRISDSDLDEFLASHLIPVKELRVDDFDSFIRIRASKLLDLIAIAMGKPILGCDSEETKKAFGGSLQIPNSLD